MNLGLTDRVVLVTGGKVATPIHLPGGAASTALFLSSERAAYVIGAILPMDGGLNPVI
jgi:NAD(P)-dependent dehydrogenase (short-subunit alcohol dehydrogenase family)